MRDGLIDPALFLTSETTYRHLVDMNKDGKLGRDEFAVALHLMRAKQKGERLPKTLPDSLVPPASRERAVHNSTAREEPVGIHATFPCFTTR